MLKRIASYFIPINIYKETSKISNSLEVTWNNGELVLDSKNANYSYGSLKRALIKGLKYIGYNRIKKFNSVLVLGVAGGSVIKTLRDEIGYNHKIIGVEIDKSVIDIANKYFKLNHVKNLNIIIDDAFSYVLKTKDTYDLVIIDVFKDTDMPSFLFEDFFIEKLKQIINVNGFILFNTMVLNDKDITRNHIYRKKFNDDFSLRLYPKIEAHNEIFTIKRLR